MEHANQDFQRVVRSLQVCLEQSNQGARMKTMSLVNQKGGVGKSFVSTQLSFHLVASQLRVLAIDLDHQRNFSVPLMKSGRAVVAPFHSAAMLAGDIATLPLAPLVLVPGDASLCGLERQPDRHNEFVGRLKQFLSAAMRQFDVCIIDTNPNPDIRYAAALVCSDFALSPMQLNQEALAGIGALLNHPRYGLHRIRARINPALGLLGVLPNMVEPTQFQRHNLAQLIAAYPQLLIQLPAAASSNYAFIPKRTAIAEAQGEGVPLWELRHASKSDKAEQNSRVSVPVRSAAREAWREVRPVFVEIERRLGLESKS